MQPKQAEPVAATPIRANEVRLTKNTIQYFEMNWFQTVRFFKVISGHSSFIWLVIHSLQIGMLSEDLLNSRT